MNKLIKNKIFIVLPKNMIKKNKVYCNQNNVISYEDFFEDYLDPAVKRWNRQR